MLRKLYSCNVLLVDACADRLGVMSAGLMLVGLHLNEPFFPHNIHSSFSLNREKSNYDMKQGDQSNILTIRIYKGK